MYSSEIYPCCVFITWGLGGVGGGGGRGAWPRSALHSSSEKIFRCPPLMAWGWAFFLLPEFQCSWELMIWFLQSMIFFPPLSFLQARSHCIRKAQGRRVASLLQASELANRTSVDTGQLFGQLLSEAQIWLCPLERKFFLCEPWFNIFITHPCLCFLTYTSITYMAIGRTIIVLGSTCLTSREHFGV